jgi:hypothetical protein
MIMMATKMTKEEASVEAQTNDEEDRQDEIDPE